MTQTHCLRGHAIAEVGRSTQRMCRACLRAWDRARNQRRRQEPAYLQAEASYMVTWHIWRGYMRHLNARIAGAPALIQRLVEQGNAIQAGFGDALRFTPPPEPEWDGDPHSLVAPPYRYKSGPGYPRITREVVEQIKARHE